MYASNCQSIIPSSETSPPPPISCLLIPTSHGDTARPDPSSTPSDQNNVACQPMGFTQSDDFQDFSKSELEQNSAVNVDDTGDGDKIADKETNAWISSSAASSSHDNNESTPTTFSQSSILTTTTTTRQHCFYSPLPPAAAAASPYPTTTRASAPCWTGGGGGDRRHGLAGLLLQQLVFPFFTPIPRPATNTDIINVKTTLRGSAAPVLSPFPVTVSCRPPNTAAINASESWPCSCCLSNSESPTPWPRESPLASDVNPSSLLTASLSVNLVDSVTTRLWCSSSRVRKALFADSFSLKLDSSLHHHHHHHRESNDDDDHDLGEIEGNDGQLFEQACLQLVDNFTKFINRFVNSTMSSGAGSSSNPFEPSPNADPHLSTTPGRDSRIDSSSGGGGGRTTTTSSNSDPRRRSQQSRQQTLSSSSSDLFAVKIPSYKKQQRRRQPPPSSLKSVAVQTCSSSQVGDSTSSSWTPCGCQQPSTNSNMIDGDATLSSNHNKSLVLVAETPVETEASLSSPCSDFNKSQPDKVDRVEESRSEDENNDHLNDQGAVDHDGSDHHLVYARPQPGSYFYAGRIQPSVSTVTGQSTIEQNKLQILFDDGSLVACSKSNLLPIELLPVGTQISVDLDDDGEFWSGYRVERLHAQTSHPYELTRVSPSNDKSSKLIRAKRKQVAIHTSRARHLMDTSSRLLTASPTLSTSTGRLRTTPRSTAASPNISLDNVVFGKRSVKIKRLRDSWISTGPVLSPHRTPVATSSAVSSSDSPARVVTRQATNSGQPCVIKHRRSLRLSKRPRSSASLREQQEEDDNSIDGQIDVDQSSADQPKAAKQACLISPLVKSDDDDVDQPTQPMTKQDSSNASAPATKASREAAAAITSLAPSNLIFSRWLIAFTGFATCDATSSNSNQLETNKASNRRQAMEHIVQSGGGQIHTGDITPQLLAPSSPESLMRHIALIAPSHCRTVKFFQALASLGRVALLHPDWLQDSCCSYPGTDNLDVQDWPMQLLIEHPGRYELSRGVISASTSSSSSLLVNWSSVDPWYLGDNQLETQVRSLFNDPSSTETQQPCRMLAVITSSTPATNSFQSVWLNILALACGSCSSSIHVLGGGVGGSDSVATLLASIQQLLAPVGGESSSSREEEEIVNFILVDQSLKAIPKSSRDRLTNELSNCRLVTCDFIVQSLIAGRLLDPFSSTLFTI